MVRIIAFANQKGGVSKTTTTLNLGAALAERGRKVLLIDMDPQANLTAGVGMLEHLDESATTIADILAEDRRTLADAIYPTAENMDLVPSDLRLATVEFAMGTRISRETIFRAALSAEITSQYDYILIDSPPNLGTLVFNILTAAREVVIPVATHFFSLQGLVALLDHIELVREKLNPGLTVTGILATRHRANTRHAQAVLEEMAGAGVPLFHSIIDEAIKLTEAPSAGQSILRYAPKSPSAEQYRQLALEIDGQE